MGAIAPRSDFRRCFFSSLLRSFLDTDLTVPTESASDDPLLDIGFEAIVSRAPVEIEDRPNILENCVSTTSAFIGAETGWFGEFVAPGVGADDTVPNEAATLLEGPIVDRLFAFSADERPETSRRRSSTFCAGASGAGDDDLSFLNRLNNPRDDFSFSAILKFVINSQRGRLDGFMVRAPTESRWLGFELATFPIGWGFEPNKFSQGWGHFAVSQI